MGGPAPPVPLPRAPRVSHQRGGPAWLHPHHEPTLSTLNSVKQHINQRPVQMSARTSACFKNDHHTSSYLAVWSPHEDTLSDFWLGCFRNLRESVCRATCQSLVKNKEKNLSGLKIGQENLMREFMMFENVLTLMSALFGVISLPMPFVPMLSKHYRGYTINDAQSGCYLPHSESRR